MTRMDAPARKSAVSLFTGAGGLDIGFAQAGFEVIWANDVDLSSRDTYMANFPESEYVVGSISDPEVRARLPRTSQVDVVIGGPPCQGFSVAGKMDPRDPRSQLVWDFFDVVEQLRPGAFVMENVKALAVNRRWSKLLRDLTLRAEGLGYATRLEVLNAKEFGVPQARERMFLIGRQSSYRPCEVRAGKSQSSTPLRDVLREMPPIGSPGNDSICKARITLAKNPVLRRSPYAGMLFNGQGRPLDLSKPSLTLPASMGGNRTPIVDEEALREGKPHWVEWYHSRLLSGGDYRGPVPNRLRRISVEEAAAIQTFPPGMAWRGTQSAQYRQIGNAVPPRLSFAIAQSLG
jgi:DNA (cytosine-5)-methyltransferase 1